jgi:hypothetical protein
VRERFTFFKHGGALRFRLPKRWINISRDAIHRESKHGELKHEEFKRVKTQQSVALCTVRL